MKNGLIRLICFSYPQYLTIYTIRSFFFCPLRITWDTDSTQRNSPKIKQPQTSNPAEFQFTNHKKGDSILAVSDEIAFDALYGYDKPHVSKNMQFISPI
jgi:hypothetical protein